MRIVGCPAGYTLKQTYCADSPVTTKIEPVKRAARNADQVARLDFDCHNRALLRMDVEESSSADYVPDLVFIMAMFDIELREHGIEPWRIPVYVDDVCDHVSAAALEFINLFCVSNQKLFGGGVRRNAGHWFPAFVINANTREKVSNLVMFLQRSIFVGDTKDSRGNLTSVDQRQDHMACVLVWT